MDTLVVALRQVESTESPIRHIHAVLVREEAKPEAEVKTGDNR